MSPWGPFFFSESLIFSPTVHFLQDFPFKCHLKSFFPIQMHRRPMLTVSYNRSRSSQGHDLYIHYSTCVIDASCQVSLKPVRQFRRRRFLKGFTIYGHCGQFGHVTKIIDIYIRSHFLLMLHIKFGFNWSSGFREDL